MGEHGDDAQGLGGGVENGGEAGARIAVVLFFGYGPGLSLDDVFIDGAEQGPEGFQGTGKLVGFEETVVLGDGLPGELGDGGLGGSVGDGGAGIGNLSCEVTRIIERVRLARLPRPLARSLLKRCTRASKENDPSCPKTISRKRK